MELETLLREKRDEILRIVAEHGGPNVRVFGSVARGQSGPESDIDLERGRSVDVFPEDSLKPRVRDAALKAAIAV